MAFPKGRCKREYALSSEEYGNVRRLQSIALKGQKGHEPWNKGKTGVYSEDTLKKLRVPKPSMQGVAKSHETKQKMSEAVRKRYKEHPETFGHSNTNKRAITNGEICKYINKDEPLPEGFTYGQGKRKSYIIKNHEDFCRKCSERARGEKNGNYGHGEKIRGGNNGKAIYIYTYLGVDYLCRDDLITALKPTYPTISESAIRRIMSGEYTHRISDKYQGIIDNLTWRLKKDENNKDN